MEQGFLSGCCHTAQRSLLVGPRSDNKEPRSLLRSQDAVAPALRQQPRPQRAESVEGAQVDLRGLLVVARGALNGAVDQPCAGALPGTRRGVDHRVGESLRPVVVVAGEGSLGLLQLVSSV